MASVAILLPTNPAFQHPPYFAMPGAGASANLGLGSLVFDCEVEEHAPCTRDAMAQARKREQLGLDREKLQKLSTPPGPHGAQLLRDTRYFLKEESETDVILLATKLSSVGYNVNVRTALGGGTACFRNLRHEFLTARCDGDYEGTEFIIEPRFREHFLIPHPSDEYTELLSQAPDVYVGTNARLVPIVQMLCIRMADSFEQKGLTLPPWRRTQSMLSKWLPNRMRDMSFSRTSAPPSPYESLPVQSGIRAVERCAKDVAKPTARAVSYCSDAAAFARMSEPTTLLGVQPSQYMKQAPANQQQPVYSKQQPQQPMAARALGGQVPRNEDCYQTSEFIPFNGAGGCSSDTEAPSPPTAGDNVPPVQNIRPAHSTATPGAGAGGCGLMRQNSLLAARLSAAKACSAVQTQPPAYCGEGTIHVVRRLGFTVAASGGDGGGTCGASTNCDGDHGKTSTVKATQDQLVGLPAMMISPQVLDIKAVDAHVGRTVS